MKGVRTGEREGEGEGESSCEQSHPGRSTALKLRLQQSIAKRKMLSWIKSGTLLLCTEHHIHERQIHSVMSRTEGLIYA